MKEQFPGDLDRNIGMKIRKTRKTLQWSQTDLAERVGTSTEHISRIERGGGLSIILLVRICQVLDLSIDELFDLYDADQRLTYLLNHCDPVFKEFVKEYLEKTVRS